MTHFLYWTQEDSHSQAEDWGEPDCKMLFHENMTEILMKGSQLSRAVSSYVPWRYSPLADILSVWRREKNPFLLAYYTSDKGQGLSEVVTHTTTEVGYVILKLFSSNFFTGLGDRWLCACVPMWPIWKVPLPLWIFYFESFPDLIFYIKCSIQHVYHWTFNRISKKSIN